LKKDSWKRDPRSFLRCLLSHHLILQRKQKNFMHLVGHLQVKVLQRREKLYWKPPSKTQFSYQ
jgi:hypothetical protein